MKLPSKKLMKELAVDICIWTVAMTFAFLVPLDAHPQAVNCNSIVALDEAHVFTDSSAISKSASGLIDQGADVHVVSTNMAGVTALSQVESGLEKSCPSWLANGHRKPNLFVVMVSPSMHKKNVFFGGAYTPALESEDAVNTIYSQSANPFFKQGDFTGGAGAALRDFSAKVSAFHDQQKHPVQQTTTVNNQATDLSGFWTFLGWVLGLGAAGLLTWGIFALINFRRKQGDSVSVAQDEATKARNRATRLYNSYSPVTADLSARFLDLSNSVSNDPTSEGLTALKYQSIRDVWNDFSTDVINSQSAFSDETNKTTEPRTRRHTDWPTAKKSTPVTPPAPQAPVSTTVNRTVVVHNDNSGDLLTGVLLGEALSPTRRDYDYDRPSYSAPSSGEGSDSSWSSSSSSDDSSSGSDSSFSSDSGSDFGGGGSDSGF